MCLNPKKIYLNGEYKKDCWKAKAGEHYTIEAIAKCGVCSQCIAEKANNWVIRNDYESKAHKDKCFITLTYAKNPIFLVKKDLQDFKKRLRKELEKNKIKIRTFDVGEYGTKKKRPHFHIIIYGWKEEKPKYLGLSKKGFPIYQSELIQKTWGLGRTTYQKFSDYEIPYIALYNTSNENIAYYYKAKREKVKNYLKKFRESTDFKEIINILEKAADKKKKQTDEKRKMEIMVYSKYKKELDDIMKKINFAKKKPYERERAKQKYLYYKSIINQIEQLEEALKELEKEKDKYVKIKEFNTWSKAMGWEEFQKEYFKYEIYDFNEYIRDYEFATPTSWVKKLANLGLEDARKEMARRTEQEIKEAEELKALNAARAGKAHIRDIEKRADDKERKQDEWTL